MLLSCYADQPLKKNDSIGILAREKNYMKTHLIKKILWKGFIIPYMDYFENSEMSEI